MKELEHCFKCGSQLGRKIYEGRKRYYCSDCDEVRFRNSIPVAGVFVVRDGEVLLIRRGNDPNKGKWSYPAGYLEYDEKPEIGAARELEEETGLSVDPEILELISTIHLEHPDKFVVGNAYAADFSSVKGDVKAGSDAEDARFWALKEMKEEVEKMESPKIIDAAIKSVQMVKD